MIISSDINTLAEIIRQGGVIAYPTEAVWGLGCDPHNETAVRRILTLKQRAEEKGLILVAGNLDQLTRWEEGLDESAVARLRQIYDRPTTWVVPDTTTPAWVRGSHQSLALRFSQYQLVQDLCRSVGFPIISTSANPAGDEPARSLQQVITYFGEQLDGILDAPLGGEQQPSQILDLLTGKPFRS